LLLASAGEPNLMRIAVFHDLPSGGAKRTLHELVKRLRLRHAIELYALTTADESFCDLRPLVAAHRQIAYAPSRLFNAPFGRLNQIQRWRDLGRLSVLGRALATRIDAEGYDIVWAEPSRWTQAPPLLSYLATPSVYHFHEPPRVLYEPLLNERAARSRRRVLDYFDPLPRLFRARARRLDWLATRAARRVVVNSRFTGDELRRIYGVESDLAYRGVDVERFRPGAEARRREVLSVGAIQPSKGFDFLLHALAELPASVRPPLRIVGNSEVDDEAGFLAGLAARLGVELHIEVGLDDAELARRYAEAALLVYAPHREPLGLAPLEAMACATPVVAVAEGGVPETVVDGVTGRLVPRDARAFAAVVGELLADASARQRMGRAAREHVCRAFSWDVAVARVEREFLDLVRSPAR